MQGHLKVLANLFIIKGILYLLWLFIEFSPISLIYLFIIVIPTISVGLYLKKYKRWARYTALILGVIYLPDLPFGTLLGVYSLWVLLSPEIKGIFRQVSFEDGSKLVIKNSSTSKLICPYCKDNIKKDDIISCTSCGTPHHIECWIENKGCTIFGCSNHFIDS